MLKGDWLNKNKQPINGVVSYVIERTETITSFFTLLAKNVPAASSHMLAIACPRPSKVTFDCAGA